MIYDLNSDHSNREKPYPPANSTTEIASMMFIRLYLLELHIHYFDVHRDFRDSQTEPCFGWYNPEWWYVLMLDLQQVGTLIRFIMLLFYHK